MCGISTHLRQKKGSQARAFSRLELELELETDLVIYAEAFHLACFSNRLR